MSATLTVIGNLAADPELKFTAAGKPMARFTVMTSKSRKLDDGTWESVDVTGWPVTCWDRLAEHVTESLRKGDAVIVVGAASTRSWENKDGTKGSRMEVNAYEVAASMKRGPVVPTRGAKPSGAFSGADPWTPAAGGDEIPPF